ncbi:MAG TPA: hypothetical protein VG204_03530 [Terriglobia bacterium]|nr:hypothetical protein [Terriglobia bacterium]
MRSDRRILIPLFEIVAVALVLLDVALGFGAAWARRRTNESRDSLASTQHRIAQTQARVARLERSQMLLPAAGNQLKAFYSSHFSGRREAFSRASHVVRVLADQALVQLNSISYKLDPKPTGPFERLAVEMVVGGQFPYLMNFTHSLETADDFFLVRNMTIAETQSGKLAMRLTADLYVTP